MARAFTAASSQYISVASAAPLNFGTGEFTIAFWCRFPVAPPSNSVMVHKRTGGFDGGTGWEFVVTNGGTGAVRWDVQGGAVQLRATATIGTLFDGAWHHIALDHVDSNPDMVRIWFDGTMVGSTSGNLTQTVSTATPMAIGAAYNTPTTNFINGEFAELALYKRLVTDDERAQLVDRFGPTTLRGLPSAYFPLIGRASPEIDPIGGTLGTLNNAPPAAAHAPIIIEEPPQVGQDTWFESISATIAGQSVVSASLSADIPLSATITGQSTITADIAPDAAISATITGQSSVVANATLDKHLRARVDARSGVSARATYDAAASATVAAQGSVAANASSDVPISATIAGQSGITANGSRSRGLSAQIDGQSALTASAIADHGLTATIWGQSALAALLAADVPTSAVIVGQGALAATLSADASVSAIISGQSAIAATIVRSRAGSATIAALSTIVADTHAEVPADLLKLPSIETGVSSAIKAQSDITANLTGERSLSATIAAQSGIDAELRKKGEAVTHEPGARIKWGSTTGGGWR